VENWTLALAGKEASIDRIQLINSPEIFVRFEDAEGAGVEYAKNWVDNRVKKLL
jgi:hypothetical protein